MENKWKLLIFTIDGKEKEIISKRKLKENESFEKFSELELLLNGINHEMVKQIKIFYNDKFQANLLLI